MGRIDETGDFSQVLDHEDGNGENATSNTQSHYSEDPEQAQEPEKEVSPGDDETRRKRKRRNIIIAVVAFIVILLVIIISIVVSKSGGGGSSSNNANSNGIQSKGSLSQIGGDVYGQEAQDLLGSSIALSTDGKFMATGAPGFNGNFNGNQVGQVMVYNLDQSNTWQQYGPTLEGGANFDLFGTAVALSGDGSLLVVGAPQQKGYGYVKAFKFDGSNWNQQGSQLVAPALFTAYGQTVAVSTDGQVIAIGSPKQTIGTQDNRAGMINLLQWNGSDWESYGEPIPGLSANEMFGTSLAVSADGSVVAGGSPYNSDVADSSGKARVFRYNKYANGGWEKVGNDINGEFQDDRLGISVALSGDGNTFATSLITSDQRGGEVRVYKYGTTVQDWVKEGSATGEHPFSEFGLSISMSSDGTLLAAGAPHDTNNGNQYAGFVQVYQVENSVWAQIGSDIDGELADDNFGQVVALSGDGTLLAAAAPTKAHTFSYDPQGLQGTGYIRTYQIQA
jgi:hypothetical protein